MPERDSLNGRVIAKNPKPCIGNRTRMSAATTYIMTQQTSKKRSEPVPFLPHPHSASPNNKYVNNAFTNG